MASNSFRLIFVLLAEQDCRHWPISTEISPSNPMRTHAEKKELIQLLNFRIVPLELTFDGICRQLLSNKSRLYPFQQSISLVHGRSKIWCWQSMDLTKNPDESSQPNYFRLVLRAFCHPFVVYQYPTFDYSTRRSLLK